METKLTILGKVMAWRKRLMWGLGGVLALMVLAWLAVPPWIKSQAEKMASEQLGRQLRVGSIDFKPWTFELEIKDIVLAQASGQAEQLRVGRAYVNAELQSLLRWAPVIDALEIEGVRASLVHRGAGEYDIDDILAKLAAARPPAGNESPELARFAVFNIALKDWALQFDDQAVGKQHSIRDFQLSLPFLSSLPAQRDVKTEPQLAFSLNGSRFDSKGQSTPFMQSHRTDASIQIKALDLGPYLPYLKPFLKTAPVQAVSAVLGADLKVTFEENPRPSVRISGQVSAQDVVLNDRAGRALLGVKSVLVRAQDVQPLAGRVALESIDIDAPSLQVRRDTAGRLNLMMTASDAPDATKKEASSPDSARASSPKTSEKTGTQVVSAWQVSLPRLSVQAGSVTLTDESNQPKAQVTAQQLQLQATQIVWPFADTDPQAIAFQGSAQVEQSSLSFTGSATDAKASVSAQVTGFQLSALAAYLQPFLVPSLSGELQAQVQARWQAPRGAQAAALQITVPEAEVSKLALVQGKARLAQWKSLRIKDAQMDLLGSSASVQKVSLGGLQTRIERNSAGRWMVQDWLRSPPSTQAASAASSQAQRPWKLSLAELDVEVPQLSFVDRRPQPDAKKAVALDAAQIRLSASGIEMLGSEIGKKPIPVRLSLGLAAGQADSAAPTRLAAESAQINLQGQITASPLAIQLQGQLQRLPIHAVEPYFGQALNIDVLKLDASYSGRFQLTQSSAGYAVKVQGDAVLEDLQTTLRASELAAASGGVAGDELVSWKALNLRALSLDLAPGAALKLDVGEAALTDFYARILISEQGRINLADIVRSGPDKATTSVAVNATSSIASPPDSARAGGLRAASFAAPVSAPEPLIQFGQVSLINGKVFFADRFIKPNYAANLSELTGSLGAFSSQPKDGTVQMAALELRGKAEGTAQLEILGRLNPLARPVALDITGKVRDLELAPLTPYSVKYAGHGIERGKLSVDVKYLIKPDGQLTASNNIVLNQLRFGEKVEGAPNSLPVKLAVALLADRNGVIDINLPIQGSLSDPQFSIGPIVFKLIVNLVVKAITSPFSLLASAFGGGGDELSQVVFAAGSAQLQDSAKPGLDKVIKALQDRPALKMTVVGQASAQAEREGFKKERLKALVLAEKRRNVVASGSGSTATQTAAITYSEAEYPALLKAAYRRSDVPKPRNAIGMVKDIPVAEMEALLLANLPVTEQAMQELATARGVAVRDYLASRGLGSDRLFLGAPKAVASAEPWTPRAELSLASQ